ncbi:transglutaminase domain-containing protein [Bacteroidota bacterium]
MEAACDFDIDTIDFSFGIDYKNPDIYLLPGEQSDLSNSYFEEIQNTLGPLEDSIEDILKVCHWINQNFTAINAGGSMAGKVSVDELYESRSFYGCHSLALLISSVLRKYGFPAVMIETAGVDWAYDHNEEIAEGMIGHVMSEIYVEDKWILLDNNCSYVDDYDPLNPFIPVNKHPVKAYFVFAKGLDTWEYSGKDSTYTDVQMFFFADNLSCYEELFNTVSYTWKD